jgi:hypothetical protein
MHKNKDNYNWVEQFATNNCDVNLNTSINNFYFSSHIWSLRNMWCRTGDEKENTMCPAKDNDETLHGKVSRFVWSKHIHMAPGGILNKKTGDCRYIGTRCWWVVVRGDKTLTSIPLKKAETNIYETRPQSKFPTRPTASKPYIARSDYAYVIEQWCSMAHVLTVLPAFSQ